MLKMGLMDSIKGQFRDVIELVDDDGQSVVSVRFFSPKWNL